MQRREKQKERETVSSSAGGTATKRRKSSKESYGSREVKEEEEEEDLWTQLLAPLTPAEFVRRCWEAQRPVYMRSDERAETLKRLNICSSEQILQLVQDGANASNPLYYSKDVRLVSDADPYSTYDFDQTPIGLADVEEIMEQMEDKHYHWSLRLLNLDFRFERVKALLRSLDSFWKGNGGCSVTFTLVPPKGEPMPHHFDSEDRLIVQLEGNQQVRVNRPLEKGEEGLPLDDEGETVDYASYGLSTTVFRANIPEKNLVLDAVLYPGDMLYIPKNYILTSSWKRNYNTTSATPSKEFSLDMTLNLSALPSMDDFVKEALKGAMTNLSMEPGARSFPHAFACSPSSSSSSVAAGGGGYEALAQQASDLLSNAMTQAKHIVDTLQSRSRFHREDFDLGSWLRTRYDIKILLNANQGLVKINDFLPGPVAAKLLALFSSISEEEWVPTKVKQKHGKHAISRAFMTSNNFPNHAAVFDMFRSLLPHVESTFSAGRYTAPHCKHAHDGQAFTEVLERTYSHNIAFIYYLTPDWQAEHGGAFVDLHHCANPTEDGKKGNGVRYQPEFNSAICFKVPRWHQVEKILVDNPRYAVFGWFLKRE